MQDVHRVTSVQGRWVRLRPVSRIDYPTMFQWRADVEMVHLWNFSRRVGSYEEFVGELEKSILGSLLLVIIDRETDQLIGYAQSYNASPWDRWTYLATYLTEEFRGKPHFPETVIISLDNLFKWFPLTKIYVEPYEFASLVPILPAIGFVEEGFTPEHYWHDGRFWGIYRFALYRESWPEARERLLGLVNLRQQPADSTAR